MDNKHLGIVTGGASVRKEPPPVRTKDEAIHYLQNAIEMLKQRRHACNVIVPGDTVATVKAQKAADRRFLIHIGRCMEAASLLCAVGLIDVIAFDKFHQEALNTMAPTIVGVTGAQL